jgi:hypothetical protein
MLRAAPNRRSTLTRLAVLGAALASALAGCSSSASSGHGSSGASGRFATALRYVPAGAVSVDYTDWAALGHPKSLPEPSFFAGAWASFATLMPEQVGVGATAADWELDVTGKGRVPIAIMQFPTAAELSTLSAGLVKNGWHRSGSGSGFTLAAPSLDALPSDGSFGWAQLHDYRIDTGSRLLVQYPRGTAAPKLGATFAGSAPVSDLLASVGAPVGAEIRTGTFACASLGITGRVPKAPASVIGRYNAAIGPVSKVTGVLVALTDASGTRGIAHVAVPSSGAASKELTARALIGTRLAKLTVDPGVTVAADTASGPVDRFTLSASSGSRIVAATMHGGLGVDACPVH